MVGLAHAEGAQRHGPRGRPIHAGRELADIGVVLLERRPVLARFREVQPRGKTRPCPAPRSRVTSATSWREANGVTGPRWLRAPRHSRPCGTIPPRPARPRAFPPGETRGLGRPLRAVRGIEGQRVARRLAAQERDRARERGTAIEGRGPAAHHLDSAQSRVRHAPPCDPSAEGIVQGNAVVEDGGPGGAAAADASQGNALGRRVGGAAARPPEEREAGNLPENFVNREGRRAAVLGRKADDAARVSRCGPARRVRSPSWLRRTRRGRGRPRPQGLAPTSSFRSNLANPSASAVRTYSPVRPIGISNRPAGSVTAFSAVSGPRRAMRAPATAECEESRTTPSTRDPSAAPATAARSAAIHAKAVLTRYGREVS
jgi:hypothetical protein